MRSSSPTTRTSRRSGASVSFAPRPAARGKADELAARAGDVQPIRRFLVSDSPRRRADRAAVDHGAGDGIDRHHRAAAPQCHVNDSGAILGQAARLVTDAQPHRRRHRTRCQIHEVHGVPIGIGRGHRSTIRQNQQSPTADGGRRRRLRHRKPEREQRWTSRRKLVGQVGAARGPHIRDTAAGSPVGVVVPERPTTPPAVPAPHPPTPPISVSDADSLAAPPHPITATNPDATSHLGHVRPVSAPFDSHPLPCRFVLHPRAISRPCRSPFMTFPSNQPRPRATTSTVCPETRDIPPNGRHIGSPRAPLQLFREPIVKLIGDDAKSRVAQRSVAQRKRGAARATHPARTAATDGSSARRRRKGRSRALIYR